MCVPVCAYIYACVFFSPILKFKHSIFSTVADPQLLLLTLAVLALQVFLSCCHGCIMDISGRQVSYFRLISLHSYVWMFLWIPYFCITHKCYNFEQKRGKEGRVLCMYMSSFIGLAFSVLWVFFESCYSWELEYIENLVQEETCVSYLNSLREERPSIVITVTCYHMETRHKTENGRNADGSYYTRTRTYEEQVIDYVESKCFKYDSWKDTSIDPEYLKLHPQKVTRVYISKSILFGDRITADRFTQQENDLYNRVRNQGFWKNMDVTHDYVIDGYTSRISSYWSEEEPLWWMNSRYYWIFTLLCCTWVYRLAYNNATQKTSYKLVKRVFAD